MLETNKNYIDMYPMHEEIVKQEGAHELTVEYWHKGNSMFNVLTPWIYELKMVREERNRRIEKLIQGFPKEEHMQRFHGYVNDEERRVWEFLSGKKAIMP